MAASLDTRSCSYCGLPTLTPSKPDPGDQVFCCLGCRIASGIMGNDEEAHPGWAATRLGLAIFFTMNVMVFTMVLWTWNVHELPEKASAPAGGPPDHDC